MKDQNDLRRERLESLALDTGVLLGVLAIVFGLYLIYRPAAAIVGGLLLAGGCLLAGYGRARKDV